MSHFETLSAAAEFNAPASAVWDLLVDWPAIADWMPNGYIRSVECEGRGPGAVRHIVSREGSCISERLDRADEGAGLLELSMVGTLPWGLLSYTASGRVEALGTDRCRLTWRGRLEMPGSGPELDRLMTLLQKSYVKMLQGLGQAVQE